MRLAPKLALVFVAATALLLGARTYMRIAGDVKVYEADMMRRHRVVGHVLRASQTEVYRLEGGQTARHVVDLANSADGSARFDWVPREQVRTLAAQDPIYATALKGDEVQRVGKDTLVSLFPVRRDGETRGSLRVTESLAERDNYVRSQIVSASLNLVGILVISMFLAYVSGGWLVGRPVRRLVEQARRVASGNLGGRIELHRNDELGDLGAKMNAMCEALEHANERAAAEARAKEDAMEQLRHADRLATVGKLAAGIAHELGTPLSVVSGHAEMIARREVQGDKIVESAETIERQSNRIARIVRQLLDFARRKGPEGTSCDVGELTRRCASMFEPMAEKHNVRIVLDTPDEPLRATIDEESMQHIVANLMTNAIQAIPSSGTVSVKLEATKASPPDGVEAAKADAFVRMDMADTGSGIEADVLKHIFEPFFTTKHAGDGTGLGLSVVWGIVKDHGGWIDADSRIGRGTTFSVYLPRAAER